MTRDDFPSALDTRTCRDMRFHWRRGVAAALGLTHGWWSYLDACEVRP